MTHSTHSLCNDPNSACCGSSDSLVPDDIELSVRSRQFWDSGGFWAAVAPPGVSVMTVRSVVVFTPFSWLGRSCRHSIPLRERRGDRASNGHDGSSEKKILTRLTLSLAFQLYHPTVFFYWRTAKLPHPLNHLNGSRYVCAVLLENLLDDKFENRSVCFRWRNQESHWTVCCRIWHLNWRRLTFKKCIASTVNLVHATNSD